MNKQPEATEVNQVYADDHIMEALPLEEIEKRFGKSAAGGVPGM